MIHRASTYGLQEIIGTPPAFFTHADLVPGANASAVSAVPCLGIPQTGGFAAPPTISTSGWVSGKRCLAFSTSQHLRHDALAADYTNFADTHLMVAAVNIPNTAVGRTLLDYGANGASNKFLEYYLAPTDLPNIYLQDAGGAVGVAAASAQTMGSCIIIAYARLASNLYSIFELTTGGEAKLRENITLTKTGAVTFDRGVIGAEWFNTGISGSTQAGFQLRTLGVWHRAALTSAKISGIMVHFRDRLDCPVG